MITTFNHEVNNPLAIASDHLQQMRKKGNGEVSESIEKVNKQILRISDVIKELSRKDEFEEAEYLKGSHSMIKLKKSA